MRRAQPIPGRCQRLGKRYLTEIGTPAINHFFSCVDPSRIAVLNIGILEVISIMARSRNRGQITNNYFENALDAFAKEIIESNAIVRFVARDPFVMSAALIPKYFDRCDYPACND